MKLTTRGRYGLKALVDIAISAPPPETAADASESKQYASIAYLAQQQGISEAYLEQIMGSLKRAGLVVTARGAQGGYSLSRPAEEISVLDILSVLEGTTLVDCVGTDGAECENVCICSARPLWLRLQNKINAVLRETTLRDMADDYKKQIRRMNNESIS